MSEQSRVKFERVICKNNSRNIKKNENGEYELSPIAYAYSGWQAATAEAEKRIDALEGEVANLRLNIKAQEQLGYELQASNNDLREALEELVEWIELGESESGFLDKSRKALSTAPAESLQAHDYEVLERAATELEKEEEYGYYYACIVRALKVEVK